MLGCSLACVVRMEYSISQSISRARRRHERRSQESCSRPSMYLREHFSFSSSFFSLFLFLCLVGRPETSRSTEYHDCLSRSFSARSASKSRRYPREITITVDSRQNDTWLGIGLCRLDVFCAAFPPNSRFCSYSRQVNP